MCAVNTSPDEDKVGLRITGTLKANRFYINNKLNVLDSSEFNELQLQVCSLI